MISLEPESAPSHAVLVTPVHSGWMQIR